MLTGFFKGSGVKEEITVRKTLPADRAALLEIIGATSNLTGEEKDCAAELLEIYCDDPFQKDYQCLTALSADCPVGYACYGGASLASGVFDLYWIAVSPKALNSGVGGRLIEALESELVKEGARMVVAETSGLSAYEPARRFYLKRGFREEARIKEFYKPGDDKVFFVKRF